MNTIGLRTRLAVCFGVAVLAGQTCPAQEAGPAVYKSESGVHRMDIYNGPLRSVYFFGGAAPGELDSYRNAAYAERQADLANQLLDLRNQYVNDERILENRRRTVQQQWYGYANQYSLGYGSGSGYPYYGYGGYSYPGFGVGSAYLGGFSTTASNNLAYGVGDEGAIKAEFAHALAGQATPEFAALAGRQLDTALARVSGPGTPGSAQKTGITQVGYQSPAEGFRLASPGAHVIVTCKIGDTTEKIDGALFRENADWIVIKTPAGNRTIPKRQVVDVLEPGEKPAPDK
jgi:hypothetical protein